MDDDVVEMLEFAGRFDISDLVPDTLYSIRVESCTSAGCISSPTVQASTLAAEPEDVPAPTLNNEVDGSVRVSFAVPAKPNGPLVRFEILRDGDLMDSVDFDSRFVNYSVVDTSVLPFTMYTYAIRAINTAGSTVSPAASIRTNEGSPAGLDAPTVEPLSPRALEVSWEPPMTPNGQLVRYEVYVRVVGDANFVVAFSGTDLSTLITDGINPDTEYEVSVAFFNSVDSVVSEVTTVRTAQAGKFVAD